MFLIGQWLAKIAPVQRKGQNTAIIYIIWSTTYEYTNTYIMHLNINEC